MSLDYRRKPEHLVRTEENMQEPNPKNFLLLSATHSTTMLSRSNCRKWYITQFSKQLYSQGSVDEEE